MSRRWMGLFILLGLALVGLAWAIVDLKHPDVSVVQCDLKGRGASVQQFKASARVLYTRSGKTQDDIALTCPGMGNVVINDDLPLPLEEHKPVQLTQKQYRLLPDRYQLSVPVINPNQGAETNPNPSNF